MRCCLSMRRVQSRPHNAHTLAYETLRQEWIQQRISCTNTERLCDYDDACREDKGADGRGDRGACKRGFSGKNLPTPADGEQDVGGGTAVKRIVSVTVLNKTSSAGVICQRCCFCIGNAKCFRWYRRIAGLEIDLLNKSKVEISNRRKRPHEARPPNNSKIQRRLTSEVFNTSWICASVFTLMSTEQKKGHVISRNSAVSAV